MSAVLPYIVAIFSITLYATLSPISKRLQFDLPPFTLISISMFFLSFFATISSFFFEKDFKLATIKPSLWAGLGLMAFINFVGFALYLYAIKRMPVSEYQLMGLLSPIVGGFVAYLLMGEPIKSRYLLALLFIGVGLFIALYESTKT